MNNTRPHWTMICLGISFLLILVACANQSTGGAGVDLVLRGRDGEHIELVVTNRTGTPLKLPADIVNGPRDPNRSVFLVARDSRGHLVKRCAIVEVEPEKMHDVDVQVNETVVMPIALATIAATYCKQQLRMLAEFGRLSRADKVDVQAKSNVLEVALGNDSTMAQ